MFENVFWCYLLLQAREVSAQEEVKRAQSNVQRLEAVVREAEQKRAEHESSIQDLQRQVC